MYTQFLFKLRTNGELSPPQVAKEAVRRRHRPPLLSTALVAATGRPTGRGRGATFLVLPTCQQLATAEEGVYVQKSLCLEEFPHHLGQRHTLHSHLVAHPGVPHYRRWGVD